MNCRSIASHWFWLAHHGDAARDANLLLAAELRAADVVVDLDLSGRAMKAQLKMADREKAAFCVVVGDQELTSGVVNLKDLAKGEQTTVPRGEIVARLRDLR